MSYSSHWQDSEAELKASMQVLFSIDRSQGAQHILESAKLITVWKQARVRSDTQPQVEASARAHGLPLELPHGTWGNLLKGFATKFGDKVPKQELPSQSYFEQLEEMLQDGLLYAKSLTQVVSLEAELQHMRSASDSSNFSPRGDVLRWLHAQVKEASLQPSTD